MAVSEINKSKIKRTADYFIRFSMNQRVQHHALMIAFIVLTVTGLAERFYTAGWAEWLILNMGGIAVVRLVHRAFGLIFTLSGLFHIAYIINVLSFRRAQPTMIPNYQDIRNIAESFRRTFGISKEVVKYPRYDYRQKFEYWGIIFGGTMMTLTGFILAFPIQATIILPGQFIAAAREAHGNEAMLAALTIVIWHLYDVIFKPAIFPADFSIFTGKISKKRMMEEHALEYEEATGETVTEESLSECPPEKR